MTYVKLTKEKSPNLSQKSTDQELLRSAIVAELDAINLYQSQIENTSDQKSKEVIKHVMDEEKEHVAELTCALIKLDSGQEKQVKEFLKSVDIEKLDCLNHIKNKEKRKS